MSTTKPNDDYPPTPPSEPSMLHKPQHTMPTEKSVPVDDIRHIWVVSGPSGCGKTSVAQRLRDHFQLPFLEGDNYHSPGNVQKMKSGHPLTDEDRWDWLITIREEALKTLKDHKGVFITCSALKRKYRDVMRVATYHNPSLRVNFIYLNASESVLQDRVKARKGHYMKDNMVHSQFQSLEAPMTDESDILSVDASGTSSEVQELAISVVNKALKEKI